MSEEIEEPLAALDDAKKSEVVTEAVKEIDSQDVLVCGKCHRVFHFVEGFQEHKAEDDCKEDGELKETLKEETKPQIWAFTLWKNSKFRGEGDKPPTSWSIYQLWRDLDAKVKDVWTKAGENIQALYDIANQYEDIKITKSKQRAREMLENEEEAECAESLEKGSKEKDPLGMDSESGPESSESPEKGDDKTILKPVQYNSKKVKNTRKAIRTASDPKTEYLVEKIVSKRYNPRKKTFEYLIKWENFEAEKNTWEPIAGLQNCKLMLEEFEKNFQIQKEQQRLEKSIAKKNQKKQALLALTNERPQRTSKQKALDQVKAWCGNMEADENSGKRLFSDDSDDDDSFEKRMKYEDYSSDSENEAPVVTIKRIPKSQNGIEKKPKIESITLPNNILIPDAKGVVRINQKQIPSLSSGVYVMSKTAGIIKLDTKMSKLATSGGQTVLKVAPKIGQTSIKVIKKDVSNGSFMTKTANILRPKPVIRNYSSRVYMQKRTNAINAQKKSGPVVEPAKEDHKDDDESDGVEELEFPTDIPISAPDSPPSDFTLCPLTGKVLGIDGKPIEEPEPKVDDIPNTVNDTTTALDNLVNMAAADILEDLQPEKDAEKLSADKSVSNTSEIPMGIENPVPTNKESGTSEESKISIDIPSMTTTVQQSGKKETKVTASDSILSTALTNANIMMRRPAITQPRVIQKHIVSRTPGHKTAPQAIITRITPGMSPIQRSRVMAPKPRDAAIIRKRVIGSPATSGNSRSLVRKIGDTKVYTPTKTGHAQQMGSVVATPTSSNIVINMPSLIGESASVKSEPEATVVKKEQAPAKTATNEGMSASSITGVGLNSLTLTDSETPLLITGEDGTIYQVAGQNEDGQTILITQGDDGEQQCLLVAPENAGLINQALMKPTEPEPEPLQTQPPAVTEPIVVNTEPEEATDDSQVVAQIVSANPPSPGGTRKVVLMLPDGNFMMTEVTAEQYAALELDK